jgi:hypothetical protein
VTAVTNLLFDPIIFWTTLLIKLANMLRAEERRPKAERDHELVATINRTIEDLKRQREQRDKSGRD